MSAKLILIRGVPGTGKSTLAQLLRKEYPGAHWHESDQYFETPQGFKWEPTRVREAHVQCQMKVYTSLCAGKTVVVSNTFCGNWSLRPYYDIVRVLDRKSKINVEIINLRKEFGSVHDIPEEAMERFRDSWEEIDVSELHGLDYTIVKNGAKLLKAAQDASKAKVSVGLQTKRKSKVPKQDRGSARACRA